MGMNTEWKSGAASRRALQMWVGACGLMIAAGCAAQGEDEEGVELRVAVDADGHNLPVGPQAAEADASCTIPLSDINSGRELVIRATAIVDDPTRTQWNGSLTGNSGVWHFGRLMTQMAGDNDPSDFVESWLGQWMTNHTVNGDVVPRRTAMRDLVLDAWPRRANGKLDLTRAPMRLLAIVNRVDLASGSDAGEGRFVFGVLGPDGEALQFTIILEYDLPLSEGSVEAWTQAWHELSAFAPTSSGYKQRLQAITQAFAGADAMPERPNGSAISQVRSNEIALSVPWELREFKLTSGGQLRERPVALTPAGDFLFTTRLGRFINQNEEAILAQEHVVPASFEGEPFRGGAILNNIDFWGAANVENNEARHLFSLNTCNGCHGGETETFFLHVNPREAGDVAALSPFMTGGFTFNDPVSGEPRTFDDIARRRQNVRNILCAQ